jgi:alpha-galactosidase
MAKIAFLGAGSTIFARSIIGDCMLTPSLQDSHVALYDIDGVRLKESKKMLDTLNANINSGRAKITTHLGVENRKKALKGANYVVNAVQIGGYEPSTVIDFEIPKKFGLRQTIGDTLGIGGIFRGLRTVPVMWDFARDMEEVCPDAWLLNYSNPMSILTGAVLLHTNVKMVGLCHSVQGCADSLLRTIGLDKKYPSVRQHVAGINHMAWLLSVTHDGKDLYPEIKTLAAKKVAEWRKTKGKKSGNMVRLEMMRRFGYYITESSEHLAEYTPYWIKARYPELIGEFNIPLDEYPRRCIAQIERWKKISHEIVENPDLTHARTHEYGSYIMEAIETDAPVEIGGNVLNKGLITNLPAKAIVEVPCLVNRNGVQGCHVGDLPEACAALNRTNINVHLLTVEAAATRKREVVYQAALLDPHTSAELSIDDTVALCDELIKAHGSMLPKYR